MLPSSPPADSSVVILSGAGLSAASGVPTFRGAGGLWEGHRAEDLATPGAWRRDRDLVRAFYSMRLAKLADVEPNPGHLALARLQHAWGPERVALVTQNVDGLLQDAGADEVIEMHGTIRWLRCERDLAHPRVQLPRGGPVRGQCGTCGADLRPDVVWFGEMPQEMDRIHLLLGRCAVFVSVGTSGNVYPAAGFSAAAAGRGARCVEINPTPTGGVFDEVVAEGSETALPRLVDAWLG